MVEDGERKIYIRLDAGHRLGMGHLFRMMTANELRASAQRERNLGYEHIAQKRERIADSLPD